MRRVWMPRKKLQRVLTVFENEVCATCVLKIRPGQNECVWVKKRRRRRRRAGSWAGGREFKVAGCGSAGDFHCRRRRNQRRRKRYKRSARVMAVLLWQRGPHHVHNNTKIHHKKNKKKNTTWCEIFQKHSLHTHTHSLSLSLSLLSSYFLPLFSFLRVRLHATFLYISSLGIPWMGMMARCRQMM